MRLEHVPPQVADLIQRRGFFGYKRPAPAKVVAQAIHAFNPENHLDAYVVVCLRSASGRAKLRLSQDSKQGRGREAPPEPRSETREDEAPPEPRFKIENTMLRILHSGPCPGDRKRYLSNRSISGSIFKASLQAAG